MHRGNFLLGTRSKEGGTRRVGMTSQGGNDFHITVSTLAPPQLEPLGGGITLFIYVLFLPCITRSSGHLYFNPVKLSVISLATHLQYCWIERFTK